MKQSTFEALGAARWQRLAAVLPKAERASRSRVIGDAFLRDYRSVCRDLSLAAERGYSARLVDQLNELALRGHNAVYVRRAGFLEALKRFVAVDFPRQVRAEWRCVLLAAMAFLLPMLVTAVAISNEPDAVYAFLAPDIVAQFEAMYDTEAEHVGRPLEAENAMQAFGFYIANNIGIAFRCFATGIVFGIGTLFFLVYNGFAIGATATHLVLADRAQTFFPFVIGHGAFELTAIVLAGAAGLKLGGGLLWPGRRRRTQALLVAAHSAIRIVYGAFGMLVIAAFLEAFWSANALIAPWTRYLVGGLLWLLVFVWFAAGGRRASD